MPAAGDTPGAGPPADGDGASGMAGGAGDGVAGGGGDSAPDGHSDGHATSGLSRREVLRRAGLAGAVTLGGVVLGRDALAARDAGAAAGYANPSASGAGAWSGLRAGDVAAAGGQPPPTLACSLTDRGTPAASAASAAPAAGVTADAAESAVASPTGGHHGHQGQYGHGVAAPTSLRADHLDAVTYPPPFDGRQGVTRTYDLPVTARHHAVAEGAVVEAWTYAGSVPGPIIRATEGDRLRIRMQNHTSHAHNVHLHGRHDPAMDGWEPIPPGAGFTYEVTAAPFGLHPYHCHTAPIAEHIARGLYGAMIIDPPGGRPPAHEVVLVLGGFDLDGDGRNEVVAFNGVAGAYHRFPIRVPVGALVRVYVVNLLEHDPIASFHLHAQTFDLYRSGTSLTPDEHTDVVALTQGERAIVEFRLPEPGRYMFHPHQSRLAALGAMGWFAAV